MDDQLKLQHACDPEPESDQDLAKLRTPMTILFSDIQGSTEYAEIRGDVEYMGMIERHNAILFAVIENHGGVIVKTIGDSILARFEDPVGAIKAAAGMQQAMAKDREGRDEMDQIHVRIGLHCGVGLIKDNDVFGDVVNAAARVERIAKPDQILITETLVGSANLAGFACGWIKRSSLKGKDEPVDLYGIAWSRAAVQCLFDDLRREVMDREKKSESERAKFRDERRDLLDKLQEKEHALSNDLQSELQFQVDQLTRQNSQLEQDLSLAHQRFQAERNNLKAQIASMQATIVDAMQRATPARMSVAMREQIDAKIAQELRQRELDWQSERAKLVAEIERLRKGASPLSDEKKEMVRRAVLEKLGKLPAGAAPPAKTADQLEREFQQARTNWERDREQLNLKLQKLELELARAQGAMREELLQDVRASYESKLAEANADRQRLEQEIQFVTSELASERQRLKERSQGLEQAIDDAQQAARTQARAEMKKAFESKLHELEKHVEDLQQEVNQSRATRKFSSSVPRSATGPFQTRNPTMDS